MVTLGARFLEWTREGACRLARDDGKILVVNHGLVSLLGLDCAPASLCGRTVDDLLGAGALSTIRARLGADERRAVGLRFSLPGADGERALVGDATSEPGTPHIDLFVRAADEDPLRKAAASLLTELGYMVTTFAEGAAAVAAYREAHGTPRAFDAVILDLTIPGGTGGKEAAGRILEIDRAARIIVASGYSNDPVMGDHRAHGFAGALAKPYSIEDLSGMLEVVLGRVKVAGPGPTAR